MRIVTWNINSIRLRLSQLAQLTAELRPDVIALQEIKVMDSLFPIAEVNAMGYPFVRFSGQKSYNGVAVLSKYPILEDFSLEFYNEDKRHLAVRVGDIEIHNFYVPAGGDEPDILINPKFKHKLAYLDLMHGWLLKNRSKSQKIVLLGDLNIAPFEHDVWSSKQLKKVVSHTDIERQLLLRNLNEFGFVDIHRQFVPHSEKLYSWWSYRNLDWQKSNRGRRLDHIWLTPPLACLAKSVEIAHSTRNWPQPSDHVPVIVEI